MRRPAAGHKFMELARKVVWFTTPIPMPRAISNVHVKSARALMSPADMAREIPLSEAAAETVATAREEICRIIAGQDRRMVVVVGPCSIHDIGMAKEYADYLGGERRRLSRHLLILMRVYFEKPRTALGWKGLINDPHLDGSYDMETGLRIGRGLLRDLAETGMPAASEVLDPISPQYLAELISWAAIGARTIESQTHREMASGLSMPIGFKNGTDGTLQSAVNAMKSAREPHHFLGVDLDGRAAMIGTTGNKHTHLVLRGGVTGPNFEEAHVRTAAESLRAMSLCPRVMVDCSHDNSSKDYTRQPEVSQALAGQLRRGVDLLGVMIESNLVAGKQAFPPASGQTLRYGQSITDGCVDLTTTTRMLNELAEAVDTKPAAA
jgi:3-deoxy-7-phosphoheptulonate synthase